MLLVIFWSKITSKLDKKDENLAAQGLQFAKYMTSDNEDKINLCSFSFLKKLTFYIIPYTRFLVLLTVIFFVGKEKIDVYHVALLAVFICYLVWGDK